MRLYVLRRLLVAVPSLLIASLIVVTLPRLIPGDVVQLMLEEKAYGKDLEDLRAKLGLNRPIYVQYFDWMGSVVRGHLGESLWTRQPVLSELARRLPVTVTLGIFATIVAIAIGMPIGVLAATRQDGATDFVARSAAILGLSIPGFVLAILVTLLPAIWWGWTPPRFVAFTKDPAGHLLQLVRDAPHLCLTLRRQRAHVLDARLEVLRRVLVQHLQLDVHGRHDLAQAFIAAVGISFEHRGRGCELVEISHDAVMLPGRLPCHASSSSARIPSRSSGRGFQYGFSSARSVARSSASLGRPSARRETGAPPSRTSSNNRAGTSSAWSARAALAMAAGAAGALYAIVCGSRTACVSACGKSNVPPRT